MHSPCKMAAQPFTLPPSRGILPLLPMNVWIKTALTLAAVWMVAYGVIYGLSASKPTAESVSAYLAHTDLARLQGRDRTRTITQLENQLNDVSFDDRHKLQRSGDLHRFFLSLSAAEQEAFLDATLPADFRQIMDAFNKMDPEKRRQFVAHAVDDMQKHAQDGQAGPPPDVDPKVRDRFIDQGLRSFYKDASPDTKLDLAPLIEQMQRNLQMGAQG